MIIYINKNGEIKDVDNTTDTTLTPINVDDEKNPFKGWSVAKICCYKIEVKDGKIISRTPYVDNRLIQHIDKLGQGNETNTTNITDIQIATVENYESILGVGASITKIELALAEIYELILGGK